MPEEEPKSRIQVELLKLEPEIQGPEPKFLKIDRATVRQRLTGEPWSPEKPWEILERGDSVALLLYNRDAGTIVLVRQFRAPLVKRAPASALDQEAVMLEAIAGATKETDVNDMDAVIRETLEEVGFEIAPENIDLVAEFYPSPGACSERIRVFCGEVGEQDRKGPGGGAEGSGELIEVVELPVETFFEAVHDRRIVDSKLLVGFAAFRDRVERHRATQEKGVGFEVIGAEPRLVIRLRPGDIGEVRDAPLWVNSENTLMEMDQFVGRSVSARIRSLGAWADAEGATVRRDYIGDALRQQIYKRGRVAIGDVLETGPGRLADHHKVQRVFHVATVEGRVGHPVKGSIGDIAFCVASVLKRADRRRRLYWPFVGGYPSLLMPMIGAGKAGLSPRQVFPEIVKAIQRHATERSGRAGPLREVNLSIYEADDFAWALSYLTQRPNDFARAPREGGAS